MVSLLYGDSMANIVPICYFPSKVVVIDDNIRQIKNLLLSIIYDYNFVFFEDPEKAMIEILNSLRNIKINTVSDLHKLMKNKNRFSFLTIVCSDLSMPVISGLNVLESVPGDVKKVLITSFMNTIISDDDMEYDNINGFIDKLSFNVINKIKNTLTKLSTDVFVRLSEIVYDSSEFIDVLLHDNGFVSEFFKIILKMDISEYYLLDDNGTFCLYNNEDVYIFSINLKEKIMKDAFMPDFYILNDILYAHSHFDDFINGREQYFASRITINKRDYIYKLERYSANSNVDLSGCVFYER